MLYSDQLNKLIRGLPFTRAMLCESSIIRKFPPSENLCFYVKPSRDILWSRTVICLLVLYLIPNYCRQQFSLMSIRWRILDDLPASING